MNPEKVFEIIEKESKNYSTPVVELMHFQTKDPFKVLITTILSSRTRDETTLRCAKNLFSNVSSFSDFKKLSVSEIEKLIYPVGFYKTKARNLKKLSDLKKVPESFDSLVKLPGVGRKTANLVLSVAFSRKGIAVDTHVHRISNRLGWVKTLKPVQTEKALKALFPDTYWSRINRTLVSFGQNTCTPLRPKCVLCPVKNYCPKIGVRSL